MGFRFFRRISILPGVTLNLSKSGGSVSIGPRGAKFTIGSKGARVTAGIPGTGLSYTRTLKAPGAGAPETAAGLAGRRLSLGFFKRLVTPDDEEGLVDGCRAAFEGREEEALNSLRNAKHLPDAAWMAGFLCIRNNMPAEAEEHLAYAAANHERLGTLFSRYGLTPEMTLPVTDEISAVIRPGLAGTLLALAELYQDQGRKAEAQQALERLLAAAPEDILARLSLAELLFDHPDDDALHRIMQLSEGIGNDTEIHAALLLYKAKALRTRGLHDAARETLTQALRRTKNRPPSLLHALRYERALAYGQLGQPARMRSDLESIYAQDPDYEDVATRLFGNRGATP